jgi:type IV pilus assembly protein PilN
MAHINLLPWREAARKEMQKVFLTILAATCLCAFLAMFGVSLLYSEMITGQLKRNAHIEQELVILDRRIDEIKILNETRRNLRQRMALIEQLQSSRNLGTQVFGEVAKTVPAGIYLGQLEKKNDAVLIIGKSESNNRLSHMIRQVEESPLLQFVNLQSITAGKDMAKILSDFTMQIKVESYLKTGAEQEVKTP